MEKIESLNCVSIPPARFVELHSKRKQFKFKPSNGHWMTAVAALSIGIRNGLEWNLIRSVANAPIRIPFGGRWVGRSQTAGLHLVFNFVSESSKLILCCSVWKSICYLNFIPRIFGRISRKESDLFLRWDFSNDFDFCLLFIFVLLLILFDVCRVFWICLDFMTFFLWSLVMILKSIVDRQFLSSISRVAIFLDITPLND